MPRAHADRHARRLGDRCGYSINDLGLVELHGRLRHDDRRPGATLTATGTGYKVLGIDGGGRARGRRRTTLDWDQGDLHLGDSALIDNAGTFVAEGPLLSVWSGTPQGIHNTGDLTHDVATTTTVSNTVSSPIPVDNDGTVSVTDGTLRLNGPLANWNGTTKTLTGGIFEVVEPGNLEVAVLDVAVNAATIRLIGTASGFVGTSGSALQSLAANTADGTIEILDGRDLTTPVAFSNAGVLHLGQGSTFTTVGNFSQSAGETRLLAPTSTIDARGRVSITGGEVWGVGTIIGTSIENSGGTIFPVFLQGRSRSTATSSRVPRGRSRSSSAALAPAAGSM